MEAAQGGRLNWLLPQKTSNQNTSKVEGGSREAGQRPRGVPSSSGVELNALRVPQFCGQTGCKKRTGGSRQRIRKLQAKREAGFCEPYRPRLRVGGGGRGLGS